MARDLNVSVITVLEAMRGNTDIRESSRKRVLARMKELDYRPNMMAQSLAGRGRSKDVTSRGRSASASL